MDLGQMKCKPCEAGAAPLTRGVAEALHAQLPAWTLGLTAIEREFTFKDFRQAMAFVNRVAEVAEAEGHHPDIHIHYRRVRLELSTHDVGGLSENDFILAAKIEKVDRATVR